MNEENDPLFDFLRDANQHMRDFFDAQHDAHVQDCWEMVQEANLHRFEIEAENAWLRHAERTTWDDMGFEEYEARLGKW
jgi:hypothetical protein